MSPQQPLPPKENALFKKILRCYEHKQYKNGLKFAKQILGNPKHAEHGETLAMKGLTLNCLGRKEEAYEYVKRGLKNDLKSHICWHVYGLLQRSDHKYDEAIKCYRNALKWDKDNIQILRDLSLLQIQMRDLEGYRDTRYQLFALRPTQRASWIGFAMAYHLLKDYDTAAAILEEFRKTTATQNQKPIHNSSSPIGKNATEAYENSELLLYQVMVMKEAGKFSEALAHLDKYGDSDICDKLAVQEYRSELLIIISKLKEARKTIQDNLIARNPENSNYYNLLEQAMDLKSEQENERLKLYHDLQRLLPKAQMPLRIPLNFVTNPTKFREMIDAFLKKGLRKGQPALFRELKSIYSQECGGPGFRSITKQPLPMKIDTIQSLILNYIKCLKAYDSFTDDEESRGTEATTCLLWSYYYLAQHYDYMGELDLALEYINTALDHTPTLIELFVIKAKIYKHAGNIEEAVKCIDEAQSLDTADRYLNSKCAKYLLRANKVSEAEDMCSKFTREGVSASENLNEMQCMWFQTEAALAYQRLGKWGEALKKCIEIDRHFAEINEDQFDFHTYCMRKMTLRSYIGLLRLEDILKSHRFYFIAAKIAINVYLRLYDKPLGDSEEMEDKSLSSMSASELKKMRNKQKKAQAKKKANASKDEKESQVQNAQNEKNAEGSNEFGQEKLIPSKLERPENPLEEAIKFLKPLQILSKDQLDTHLLAFEIYYRKGKIMLMLQSLKRAVKIDRANPTLQKQLVLFYNFVKTRNEPLHEAIEEVLKLEMKKLIGEQNDISTALDLSERFLQMNPNSFPYRIENSRLVTQLDRNNSIKKPQSIKTVMKDFEQLQGVSIETCTSLMKSLQLGDFGEVDSGVIDEFRIRCHKLFPYATQFMTDEETKQLNNSDVVNHNDDDGLDTGVEMA